MIHLKYPFKVLPGNKKRDAKMVSKQKSMYEGAAGKQQQISNQAAFASKTANALKALKQETRMLNLESQIRLLQKSHEESSFQQLDFISEKHNQQISQQQEQSTFLLNIVENILNLVKTVTSLKQKTSRSICHKI